MVLEILPVLDSAEMADARRRGLDLPRSEAAALGRSAVEAIRQGAYLGPAGERVDWSREVEHARISKRSIPPDEQLAPSASPAVQRTRVQVTNETTLQAAHRLTLWLQRPVALNFANGVQPGGGFLVGARAQEEGLCRSSALFATLEGDPMYAYHRTRPRPDSSDWVIHSPDVPVFRQGGAALPRPWLLSFLTCAAPVAQVIGQPEAGDLLERRIHRVLEVASALGYTELVLGAWGCGAFGNDPTRTARDFRRALETTFRGRFSGVVFAIADWSAERRFLGPFRDVFEEASARIPTD